MRQSERKRTDHAKLSPRGRLTFFQRRLARRAAKIRRQPLGVVHHTRVLSHWWEAGWRDHPAAQRSPRLEREREKEEKKRIKEADEKQKEREEERKKKGLPPIMPGIF